MGRGIIGNVIVVLLGLFALSLIFGIDLIGLLKHPQVLGALNAVWRAVLAVLGLIIDALSFVFTFISDKL